MGKSWAARLGSLSRRHRVPACGGLSEFPDRQLGTSFSLALRRSQRLPLQGAADFEDFL